VPNEYPRAYEHAVTRAIKLVWNAEEEKTLAPEWQLYHKTARKPREDPPKKE
jgi:hypothetical protein